MTDWEAFENALQNSPQVVDIQDFAFICYGKVNGMFVAARQHSHLLYLVEPQLGVVTDAPNLRANPLFNSPHALSVDDVCTSIVDSIHNGISTGAGNLLQRAQSAVRLRLNWGLIYPTTFIQGLLKELAKKLNEDDPELAALIKLLHDVSTDGDRKSPRLQTAITAGVICLAALQLE
jgi:hypothetical protein